MTMIIKTIMFAQKVAKCCGQYRIFIQTEFLIIKVSVFDRAVLE
jgi:hypothetical protein